MTTLAEVLADAGRKRAVIADGERLIEDEVGRKSGFSGIALKTAFKTFKKIKPGVVAKALDILLPEFAPAIDPFYAQGVAAGDVAGFFRKNADTIAEGLLAVTDRKAATAENRLMVKLYKGLRGQAKGHVSAAMPGLAAMIAKHV